MSPFILILGRFPPPAREINRDTLILGYLSIPVIASPDNTIHSGLQSIQGGNHIFPSGVNHNVVRVY